LEKHNNEGISTIATMCKGDAALASIAAVTCVIVIFATFGAGSIWRGLQEQGGLARQHRQSVAQLKAQLAECYAEGNKTKTLLDASYAEANVTKALLNASYAEANVTEVRLFLALTRLNQTETRLRDSLSGGTAFVFVMVMLAAIALANIAGWSNTDFLIRDLGARLMDKLQFPGQPKLERENKKRHKKKHKNRQPVPNPGEPQHGQLPACVLSDQAQ
jgi:hypothetical protein